MFRLLSLAVAVAAILVLWDFVCVFFMAILAALSDKKSGTKGVSR